MDFIYWYLLLEIKTEKFKSYLKVIKTHYVVT